MTQRQWIRREVVALLGLLGLALLWFAPVLFPGLTHATLLPYDNLYSFAPWRALQPRLLPYNNLLSDLVLENAVWKLHIRRTLAEGQLPLWNPQIFTGVPFLAAGQASTFYPLNLLFYFLPLDIAYGWFTALQIGLAGMNMYVLGRVLRLGRGPAFLSGVIFMFSGFLMVSVVFTMFVAAAVWLPLLLAIVEIIIRKQEEKGIASFHPIPYVVAGIIVIALIILAGHPELIYYTALVTGLYTLVRLVTAWRLLTQQSPLATRYAAPARLLKLTAWLLVMALLGVAAGAIQLLPLLELAPLNFRAGSVSLQQVLAWAWPKRHIISFFLPDFFGNPSHHRWFDLWQGQWQPVIMNALGEPVATIFWGVKNYVEGGNYLGIGTWLLATVAVLDFGFTLYHLRRRRGAAVSLTQQAKIFNVQRAFFLLLALVALLFAFGTPLYALLFYGLPGWSQLHSPFRWVFPFTLSMAILAGMGLQRLLALTKAAAESIPMKRWWAIDQRRLYQLVALAVLLAGVAALAVVGLSRWLPAPFVALGQRLVNSSDLAQMTFADGAMFWSYQALNLVKFGLFALVSGGIVLWLLRNQRHRASNASGHLVILSMIGLIALDLYAAHGRFNPASDPALSPLNPASVPPVVQFINEREGIALNPNSNRNSESVNPPWRFTTFNLPGEKTFNANVGMYYGWQDIRGYDSIIPRQYVQLMDQIASQENELLYNRIAPLYTNVTGDLYTILDNPLLDLLNVKYILTEHYIPNPSWQEIYRDATIGVYENKEVLPRVFIVPEARVAAPADQPLLTSDLANLVYIEENPAAPHALMPASPQLKEARISRYTANDLFVDLNLSDRGWLVLTDAYFPGWKAYLRPFGADENAEQELPIYRADGALRTVYVPQAGQWTVRFVYSPMSFKLGVYGSFLALMATLLLSGYWLWGRYYRPAASEGAMRTVAKNSLVPMALSLVNKAIDFAFAMLYVRLLGPAGTGQYAFVVAVYGIFEILSRYGLGTLLTRDVSADKNQSSRYLTNVVALRTLLWLISLPFLGLVIWLYRSLGDLPLLAWYRGELAPIGAQEVQALLIFALSMLFANWADALSSTFMAFEKMEYPAGLANAVALLKVTLGALVLLIGWGYVGLAGVSLLMNLLQVLWLYHLLRRTLFEPEWRWDWSLQRWMVANSGPLMINHLLATIFWRIDLWILRPLAGEASVGLYSVGLKYLDGLNIIPSIFTMAIFPLMSRYARNEGDNLLRAYVLSLRLLVMVSLPIAMATTFLAPDLVYFIGGAQYLHVPETIHFFGYTMPYWGGSDLALRVIMWSIPIGFVNSVTQYVLIAVNQQRYLTKAFVIGVIFNVVGNLLLIPGFGYIGAAFVTILSEFSLLFPFYYSVKRHVGHVPWFSIFAAPALAVAVMGGVVYLLDRAGLNLWLAVFSSGFAYLATLLLTGALRNGDMTLIWNALPLPKLLRRLQCLYLQVK
ncbi:MAG: polysaccharide biosynthesis C-terminal domain-containing protein [Caldilineaceae bacterium]